MAVYQIKKGKHQGKWVVDYYSTGHKSDGRTRVVLPDTVVTEADARRYEAMLKAGRYDVQYSPPDASGTTVAHLWPIYDAHMERYRPSSAVDASVAGKHVCAVLGNVTVSTLSEAHVSLYIDTRRATISCRKAPVKDRTINKELSYLSGFLRLLREQGATDVPDVKIRYLKRRRPIPTILSVEEAVSVMMAAEPFYRAFISFLYLCGCRKSEVTELTWAKLDRKAGTATITGKGDKQRVIVVPDIIWKWLRELYPADGEGLVFKSIGTRGTNGPVRDIRNALKRASDAAGVNSKHVTAHAFRHANATHMLSSGVNLATIQEVLGHADITTTRFYSHVLPDAKQAASKVLMDQVKKVMKGISGDNGGQRKKSLSLVTNDNTSEKGTKK